jgi:hypothetical protein
LRLVLAPSARVHGYGCPATTLAGATASPSASCFVRSARKETLSLILRRRQAFILAVWSVERSSKPAQLWHRENRGIFTGAPCKKIFDGTVSQELLLLLLLLSVVSCGKQNRRRIDYRIETRIELSKAFDFPYCPSPPLECSQRYLQNRIFHQCKPLLTALLQNFGAPN